MAGRDPARLRAMACEQVSIAEPEVNELGGRHHWPDVATVLMAGGGLRGGQVIGASDADGAYPAERPVRPDEIAATLYGRFGIERNAELHSPDGRPFRILADDAQPIRELI